MVTSEAAVAPPQAPQTPLASRTGLALLQQMVDANPDFVCAIDCTCRVLAFNAAFQTEWRVIHGQRVTVGENLLASLAPFPEVQARAAHLWQRAFDGEALTTLEPFTDAQGQAANHEISVTPLRDDAGKVAGAILVTRNASALRSREQQAAILHQAQADAREARERQDRLYDTALSSIHDLVYMFDLQGHFTYANQALLDLLGREATDLVGKNFFELDYPPDLAARLQQQIQTVIATSSPLSDETPFIGASGQSGYYAYQFVPVRNAQGQVEAVAGSTRDLTARHRDEQTLQFLVRLNDAVRPLHDPKTIMTAASRLLGEFMGVSRCAYATVETDENHFTIYEDYTSGCPSCAGHYTLEAFGPDAVANLRVGQTYLLTDRQQEATDANPLAAFASIQIAAIICTSLIKDGKIVAMMAVHQTTPRVWTTQEIKLVEMTSERLWSFIEQAHAAQRLESRAREIEALNVRLRRSMTETHHRVKNNLQIIAAMIEMQMMDYEEAQTVPLHEFTRLKTHVHTLAIVHDLLTTSVKEREDAQRVSTRAMLGRLLPMLQQTAWKQTVRYAVDDVELTSRQCIALSLLLNELVSNALKHGRKEAEVFLTLEDSHVTLAVYDDGVGFPDGFDPRTAANTGLELVNSLARTDLRGSVRYGNQAGGGGQVVVTFPLPDPEV